MLKISHKLKKSYLENTRGSCKHSYLHTKAECCGNFLVSPKTQPQTVDKEGRRQGRAALHMILHLTDHAGCEKKKRSNIWAYAWSYWPDTWAIPLSSVTSEQAAQVACCEPDSRSILLASLPRAAQLNHQAKMWNLNPCNAQPQPQSARLRVSGKPTGLILNNLQVQPPKKWEPHFRTSPLPAHFHTGFKITKTNNLNQNSWKPFSPFPSSGLHVSLMADSGLLQWYLTPLASAAPSTPV